MLVTQVPVADPAGLLNPVLQDVHMVLPPVVQAAQLVPQAMQVVAVLPSAE